MPCATVFLVPPVSWMLKACSVGAGRRRLLLLHQAADLVGLAAEADDHHRREVRRAAHSRRACGAAPAAARRRCRSRSRRRASARSTPSTFGKRSSARRVGVAPEVVGDRARHRRRAVHRGQDADVVARRDAAVGADDAVEGRRRRRRTRSACAPLAAAYSRAKLENSRLWVWTCWPGAIACFALPMIWS